MKGLLIKDLELARVQKKIFGTNLVVWIILSVTSGVAFATAYLIILCTMFVITTVYYDEFENGYSYLMTLPIQRKDYVKEKYLFGLLIAFCVCVISMGIQFVFNWKEEISISEILGTSIILMSVGLGMVGVMLPCVLKFGPEKGRAILFGVMGGIFGIAYFLREEIFQVGTVLLDIVSVLPDMNMATISFLILLVVLIFYVISCKISIGIIEKKEF
ncbi:MAG: ABC-2 transporter permease [Lachnospiraceae bacterium]|nr:ABC-2 transporter permease [Lachnospiraceae bacterium]